VRNSSFSFPRDVGDSEGNVFVTGLRDISGGEAQTYLEMMKEKWNGLEEP